MNDIVTIIVLGLLIVCAAATCLTRNLLVSLVIFMAAYTDFIQDIINAKN